MEEAANNMANMTFSLATTQNCIKMMMLDQDEDDDREKGKGGVELREYRALTNPKHPPCPSAGTPPMNKL